MSSRKHCPAVNSISSKSIIFVFLLQNLSPGFFAFLKTTFRCKILEVDLLSLVGG